MGLFSSQKDGFEERKREVFEERREERIAELEEEHRSLENQLEEALRIKQEETGVNEERCDALIEQYRDDLQHIEDRLERWENLSFEAFESQ